MDRDKIAKLLEILGDCEIIEHEPEIRPYDVFDVIRDWMWLDCYMGRV